MAFERFVEVGRVVLINFGSDKGKLATIIDVVDGNKCLIDGPEELTGVARQIISYKRLALTDLKVTIGQSARAKTLKAAWTKGEIQSKWDGSSWAKKMAAKKVRAGLNDFSRFQVMVARKQKSAMVAKKVKELKA
jgi:large subunit ribosomal protein L14e